MWMLSRKRVLRSSVGGAEQTAAVWFYVIDKLTAKGVQSNCFAEIGSMPMVLQAASAFVAARERLLLDSSARTLRHLTIFACICCAVGFGAAAALALYTADRERVAAHHIAQLSATAVAAAIDRKLLAAEALLGGLAASPAARAGDFAALGSEMAGLRPTAQTRLTLLESFLPQGAAAPAAAFGFDPGGSQGAPRATRMTVGNFGIGAFAPHRELSVAMPFLRRGEFGYSLVLTISEPCLAKLIQEAVPAPSVRAGLFDRAGNPIAGNDPREASAAARIERVAYWPEIAVSTAAAGRIAGVDGEEPMVVAFSRSKLSDLVAVTEIPAGPALWSLGSPWTASAFGAAAAMSFAILGLLWLRQRASLGLQEIGVAFGLAEADRRDSELRYHAYWDHTGEASFIVDVTEDGRFLFGGLNPTHERLTGLRTENIFGREPRQVLPPAVADDVTARYRACLHAGGPIHYEETLSLPAGRRVWETSLVPVRDPESGRIVRLYGSGRDITEHKRIQDDLRLGTRRLQLAQEAAGFVALEWDLVANEGHWSPNTHPLLRHHKPQTGQGLLKLWLRLVHPDDREAVQFRLRESLASESSFTLDFRIVRNGEVRWMLGRGKILRDEANQPIHVIGMALDVSDRKHARDKLRESETLFRMVADSVPELLIRVTAAGQCIYANRHFYDFTAMSKADAAAAGWMVALHPDDKDRVLDSLKRAARAQEPPETECRLRNAGGISRWFLVRWHRVPPIESERRMPTWFASFSDVHELKRANASLRRLTSTLLIAQDEERRRIARELHDSTAQNLVAAALSIDQAMRSPCTLSSSVQDALRDSRQLIELGQREIRTLSYLLHPPLLDEIGLAAALRWYLDGFTRRTAIATVAKIHPQLRGYRLPNVVEISLYRVAQEALTNVHRHSGAKTVTLRLWWEAVAGEDQVVLEVSDDGHGFPAAEVFSGSPAPGVGIGSMRERMEHFGGRLDISSGPRGTQIRATAPLTLGPDSDGGVTAPGHRVAHGNSQRLS